MRASDGNSDSQFGKKAIATQRWIGANWKVILYLITLLVGGFKAYDALEERVTLLEVEQRHIQEDVRELKRVWE